MAAKIKYMLKQKEGVLHTGGGRFFYPGTAYSLTQSEVGCYGKYFDRETEIQEEPPVKQEEKQPDIPAVPKEEAPAKPRRRQPEIPVNPQEESPAKPEGEQPDVPEILQGENPQEDPKDTAPQTDAGAGSSTLGNLDEIMKG